MDVVCLCMALKCEALNFCPDSLIDRISCAREMTSFGIPQTLAQSIYTECSFVHQMFIQGGDLLRNWQQLFLESV